MTDQQLSIDKALALAKKHAKNGQNATAKDIYERILEQQPDHPGARRGLKKLPRDAKDKNNFRQDMERLTALYEGGQDEEALVLATKLSRKYKTQPMPLNIRGAILTKMDCLDDAIACYKKAIDLDPDYPDARSNLGMAYQLNGEAENARNVYQYLIGRNPSDVAALRSLL